MDWECELGVVIGRQASYVPLGAGRQRHLRLHDAARRLGSRGARRRRYGSDWLIAKNHDTFAPLGPFITPKEFVRDPKNLRVTFTLNGQIMQDASTSLMIHDVFELVVLRIQHHVAAPGRRHRQWHARRRGLARTPPIFLKAGDKTSCTYEGIGTLTNTVAGP